MSRESGLHTQHIALSIEEAVTQCDFQMMNNHESTSGKGR